MKGNVIVGQSGGPTAAINSSLAGVYRTAKARGAKKVYGMLHGIQGLMQEKYIDLSDHIKTELDAELLKRTPAAFLGSCRYKLPEIHEDREVYDKIFEILNKLEDRSFYFISVEMILWIRLKSCLIMLSLPDTRQDLSDARRRLIMIWHLRITHRDMEALQNISVLL